MCKYMTIINFSQKASIYQCPSLSSSCVSENPGYKEDAIKKARRYFGYFALISNETMDAFTALHLYWMKDVVEKAFGNIKERLNMRRLLVSSEKGLDGKLFVEFIALILI